MELNETNFRLYASKNYENVIWDDVEFDEDLKRFSYLKRLFNQYERKGDLKENLILNHLIILYNVFGISATEMLFLKLQGHEVSLKTFLQYLQYMPERVPNISSKCKKINNKDIPIDVFIFERLKKL